MQLCWAEDMGGGPTTRKSVSLLHYAWLAGSIQRLCIQRNRFVFFLKYEAKAKFNQVGSDWQLQTNCASSASAMA